MTLTRRPVGLSLKRKLALDGQRLAAEGVGWLLGLERHALFVELQVGERCNVLKGVLSFPLWIMILSNRLIILLEPEDSLFELSEVIMKLLHLLLPLSV